jgi:hypothetical protein
MEFEDIFGMMEPDGEEPTPAEMEKILSGDLSDWLLSDSEMLTYRVNKIVERRLREKPARKIALIRRYEKERIAKVHKDCVRRTHDIQQFVLKRIKQVEDQYQEEVERIKAQL